MPHHPKTKIIVILGAPNSDTGELSAIAKSRADKCFEIYAEGKKIICTGGWGEHFNTTDTAHAVYTRNYLLEKGIPAHAFLPDGLSSNTVDDAVKVRQILTGMGSVKLEVVTSDFHVERARLIFTGILSGHECEFIGAHCEFSDEALNKLVAHERQAIDGILKNGLRYALRKH